MGIYANCSRLCGIRLYSAESNGIYCYQTGTDKLLTKEDIMKAKDFYDASPVTLRIDILIEVSTTYELEPRTSCMWYSFDSFSNFLTTLIAH